MTGSSSSIRDDVHALLQQLLCAVCYWLMQMPLIGSRVPGSCLLQGDILVKGISNIWDKSPGHLDWNQDGEHPP